VTHSFNILAVPAVLFTDVKQQPTIIIAIEERYSLDATIYLLL